MSERSDKQVRTFGQEGTYVRMKRCVRIDEKVRTFRVKGMLYIQFLRNKKRGYHYPLLFFLQLLEEAYYAIDSSGSLPCRETITYETHVTA